MYYTYGHYKADSKELFYIGKGKGNRSHEKDSRSDYWQNIVKKYGYTVEIFAEWESEKDAFIHERFLIDCFKDLTSLCNLTNGGDGCSGYIWTDEQKAKLKLRTPTRLGAVLSEKTRKQISLSQLGISRGPHSKEHSEKISLAHKGKVKSKEHIAKITKRLKKEAQVKLTCPHCGLESNGPAMKRWHFSNCKANVLNLK